MRIVRSTLLAGAGIAVIGAVAYAADAPRTHVLTIPLPGGGVEQITYTGDVAPRVTFRDAPDALAAWSAPDGAESPFAMMQRIQAEMDREMAMVRHRFDAAPPAPGLARGPLEQVTIGGAPTGAQSYSVVSTVRGGRQCTESVEVTSQGPGQAPNVVRQTSGDCGAAKAAPAAPSSPAIPPGRRTSI